MENSKIGDFVVVSGVGEGRDFGGINIEIYKNEKKLNICEFVKGWKKENEEVEYDVEGESFNFSLEEGYVDIDECDGKRSFFMIDSLEELLVK